MKTVVGIVVVFGCVLLSAHSGFAQDKFSLSISGAPTYNYSKVNQRLFIPAIGSSDLIPVDFGSRTIGGGYTIGIVGRYAFQHKWLVSTGIWTSYNWANILALDSSIPAAYSHIGQSHQRNVQVPVLVSFQPSPRRLSPYFSAGVLLNFRSPTYVNLKYDQETRITTGKQAVTVVPTIGAGAIYRMSNHLSLAVQPTFNYYLPQGTYSSYFSGRASLQTQLIYTF